jgi:uncharacterized protein with ParB-like and HNH nuclease domain
VQAGKGEFMATPAWFEAEVDDEEDFSVREYDITAVPNDFNIRTIYDFVDSGVVSIPGFQRNYVWDIRRASKLIESLIIGLPIPQIFLYEESRNKFAVIDGQQRLMSIYYFKKKRFPREDKRPALRKIIEQFGTIPNEVLSNDDYFVNFNLQLHTSLPGQVNRFNKLNYDTLSDDQAQFDLRTVRNVVIRQNSPNDDDDSSIYEIFNRLNSGGINLTPQEIRVSLYHSRFYAMLDKLNQLDDWRKLIGLQEPDLHAKDVEILLRSFAMLWYSSEYRPSMTRFLNLCSRRFKSVGEVDISYCEQLFISFIKACAQLDSKAFISSQTNRFSISTFEAVFVAVTEEAFRKRELVSKSIDLQNLETLKADSSFVKATLTSTASSANVALRKARAKELL